MDTYTNKKVAGVKSLLATRSTEAADAFDAAFKSHMAVANTVNLTTSSHLDQYLQSVCETREARLAFTDAQVIENWLDNVERLALPELVKHFDSLTPL